jgi:hypothetical protein
MAVSVQGGGVGLKASIFKDCGWRIVEDIISCLVPSYFVKKSNKNWVFSQEILKQRILRISRESLA